MPLAVSAWPRRATGALALCCCAMLAVRPAAAVPCSADFVRSIGVNTHIEAKDTQYGDLAKVVQAIEYLGVERVRDAAPRSPAGLATAKALVAAIDRLRLTLIVMGDPLRVMPSIHALAAHVGMVEGPNEVDRTPVRFQGLTGIDAVRAAQRWIYESVHADPQLNNRTKHTPVVNFSLARPEFGPYGDLSQSADLTNVHAYAQKGVPPFWMMRPATRHGRSFLDRPVVVTETNFPTLIQPDGNGVTEPVQAKWLLAALLDSFRNDVVETYAYQLLDGAADPGGHEFEAHFGLFHFDNTPKPAATALRNLIALLKDTRGCTAQPAPAYQATLSYNVFDLLLAKPDGTFALVLWAEPVIWDAIHNVEIPAKPQARTVSFRDGHHDVQVYDPLRGQAAIAEQRDADHVTVELTDHPIVIIIR